MTHPTRYALLPLPPVCLEVTSTAHGIGFYVIVTKRAAPKLLSGVRAALPGCRVTEHRRYLARRPRWRVAAELTMTSYARPLAAERARIRQRGNPGLAATSGRS